MSFCAALWLSREKWTSSVVKQFKGKMRWNGKRPTVGMGAIRLGWWNEAGKEFCFDWTRKICSSDAVLRCRSFLNLKSFSRFKSMDAKWNIWRTFVFEAYNDHTSAIPIIGNVRNHSTGEFDCRLLLHFSHMSSHSHFFPKWVFDIQVSLTHFSNFFTYMYLLVLSSFNGLVSARCPGTNLFAKKADLVRFQIYLLLI